MSPSIYFATKKNQKEIEHLRQHEYAHAKGYSLDLETLRWTTSDDESFVMVASDGDRILSTMRGEIITDQNLLEKKLECPWDFPKKLKLPVLLLSRAATLGSHHGQGLNLILRYWFLKMADYHQLPMIVGTFVEGSPRQNTLLEMGYQFFENKRGWQQSTYRSHRPVIVAALDRNENFAQALNYCEEKLKPQIYQFAGDFPDLRYVRNL